MEAELYVVILTCLIFGSSEGFQIVHTQKQQCLFENKIVSMGLCNGTSQNQQWMWTEDGKLLHVLSEMCLGVTNSSGGPSRSAIFVRCSQAPRWTCHENKGFLEVENASLFLKKQNNKAVVRKGKKYLHSWMKIDVNEEGKPVNGSLCLKKAGLGAEISVRSIRNTAPPQVPTASSAVPRRAEHLLGQTAEAVTSRAAEPGPHSRQAQHPGLRAAGGTETAWVSWTTRPSASKEPGKSFLVAKRRGRPLKSCRVADHKFLECSHF